MNTDRFSTQRPEAVNNLLKEAKRATWSLLSARLIRDLAREQIRCSPTGYMPTIHVVRRPASAIPNTMAPTPAARMPHATATPMRGQNKVGIKLEPAA